MICQVPGATSYRDYGATKEMEVKAITLEDDLNLLVSEINEASWDESNEISSYDTDSLIAYLERSDTIFVTCHDRSGDIPVLMGMASSRIEMKPYGKALWLYVDELDVCSDQRQRGAGKLMMKKLLDIAESNGCEELWLGTEIDNHPANALYRSLNPDDESVVVGYTYETDE